MKYRRFLQICEEFAQKLQQVGVRVSGLSEARTSGHVRRVKKSSNMAAERLFSHTKLTAGCLGQLERAEFNSMTNVMMTE